MTMTLTAAKTYVAKAMGLQNDTNALSMAADSLAATYRKWDTLRDWFWCFKDTATGFTVAGTISGTTTFSPTTLGDLDGVNTGQSVTGASLPASTTVSTITRNSVGQISSILLSAAGTNGAFTLTFAGDIPIVSGTQEVNLPNDFRSPYAARLLTNKMPLRYIKYREWDREVSDHTATGVPELYTLYNPLSIGTQGYTRMRIFRTSAVSDTIHLQYYRSLNYTGTNVDIWDPYLYAFLDDARVHFVMQKNANSELLPGLISTAKSGIARVMADDEEESPDEDVRLISQMEAPPDRRIIFDPFGGDWY